MKNKVLLFVLILMGFQLNAQVEIYRSDDYEQTEDDEDLDEKAPQNSQAKKERKNRNFRFALLPDIGFQFGTVGDGYGGYGTATAFALQPKFGIFFNGLTVVAGPHYQFYSVTYDTGYNGVDTEKIHGIGVSLVTQYDLPIDIGYGSNFLLHGEITSVKYFSSSINIPLGVLSTPVGAGMKYSFSENFFSYGLMLYDLTMLDSAYPILGLQYRGSIGFYF